MDAQYWDIKKFKNAGDLIKRLRDNFGKKVENHKVYGTPESPRKVCRKTTDEDVKLIGEMQKEFRSGVGSLLY